MPRECTVSGSNGRSLIVRLDPDNQRSCIRVPDSQSVVSPPDEELRVTHVSEWFWNAKVVPLLEKLKQAKP